MTVCIGLHSVESRDREPGKPHTTTCHAMAPHPQIHYPKDRCKRLWGHAGNLLLTSPTRGGRGVPSPAFAPRPGGYSCPCLGSRSRESLNSLNRTAYAERLMKQNSLRLEWTRTGRWTTNETEQPGYKTEQPGGCIYMVVACACRDCMAARRKESLVQKRPRPH